MATISTSQFSNFEVLEGTELVAVSRLSTTVRQTSTTISVQTSDQSINDSAEQFLASGFKIGQRINLSGFASTANNRYSAVILAITASKITVDPFSAFFLTNEAAGQSVTVTAWESGSIPANQFSDISAVSKNYVANLDSFSNVAIPGGDIAFNNANQTSATVLRISTTDFYGQGQTGLFNALPDEGFITISQASNAANYLVYEYSSKTSETGRFNFVVQHRAGAGGLANNVGVNVRFTSSGSGGGGGGDPLPDDVVIGPETATDEAIALFDETTGKLIKDSAVTISTDGTFATNSDDKVPTEQAVAEYVAANSGSGGGQVAALSSADPQFGIDRTGVNDATQGLFDLLTLAIETGISKVRIVDGTYRLANQGPDAGGVTIRLIRSLGIECDPGTIFVADNLDNDMFRFIVPANGQSENGVPLVSEGITLLWRGGYFDQSTQKTSNVVPFGATYPPVNAGASDTADAISIRGNQNNNGVPIIRNCVIEGAKFVAGAHWQSSGGDSAIFMEGVETGEVRNCSFVAARDLGVYFSGAINSAIDSVFSCHNNLFEHCFGGVSLKRSAGHMNVTNSRFLNCPRAVALDRAGNAGTGTKNDGSVVDGNYFEGCGILGRFSSGSGVMVCNNTAVDHGALLADGVTAEQVAGFEGWELRGCQHSRVYNNIALGCKAAPLAAYPNNGNFLRANNFNPGTGDVPTTFSIFDKNFCDGWRRLGRDDGIDNIFTYNRADNALDISTIVLSGVRGYEIQIEPVTNTPVYNAPISFGDGSLGAPIIRRNAGNNEVGIYFSANTMHLVGAGQTRVSVGSNGLVFDTLPPNFTDEQAQSSVPIGGTYRTGNILKVRSE